MGKVLPQHQALHPPHHTLGPGQPVPTSLAPVLAVTSVD